MSDELWKRAAVDLCFQVEYAPVDTVVWEHSSRVTRLADTIVSLQEISTGDVDNNALEVAALYHDAGWVVQVQSGRLLPQEIFLRPATDLLRELGADWTTERLTDLVPEGVLNSAAQIIRQVGNRQTNILEAQVLAEADNLDEIGPQAICLMIRKQQAEGRTLQNLIDTWERRDQYNYWEARIKDCFRFPSVRRLAEHRLEKMRRFIADLGASLRLEDLRILDDSLPSQSRANKITP
ncbi:MAG: HD domain-containing protein [Planctomycetota bacterium]|nr:MAG: HD domain-containing protein [Planctomycetota bacterium]